MKQRFLCPFPTPKIFHTYKVPWAIFFFVVLFASFALFLLHQFRSLPLSLKGISSLKQTTTSTQIALALTWETKTPISLETYTYLQALVPTLNNLSIVNTLMTKNGPITLFMFQTLNLRMQSNPSTNRPWLFGLVMPTTPPTDNLLASLNSIPSEKFVFRPPLLFLFSEDISRREQAALLDELQPFISPLPQDRNTALHGFLKPFLVSNTLNKFGLAQKEILTKPIITFSLINIHKAEHNTQKQGAEDIPMNQNETNTSVSMPFASMMRYFITQSPNIARLLLSIPKEERMFYNSLLSRNANLQWDDSSNFLFTIDTNKGGEEDFESLTKEILARLFPQEISTTLPDNTPVKERVISPLLFSFQDNNNGEKTLISTTKDVQLYTAFDAFHYSISNFQPLLTAFLSQDTSSSESPALYVRLSKECLSSRSPERYTLSLPITTIKDQIKSYNSPLVSLFVSLLQEEKTLFLDFTSNNVSLCTFD